jgi:hypothetical protein
MLTFGGIGAIIALALNESPFLFFIFSSFIPIGPLIFYYSTPCSFRKELARIKKLFNDGLVSEKQYQSLRKEAVESYKQLRFGKPNIGQPSADKE